MLPFVSSVTVKRALLGLPLLLICAFGAYRFALALNGTYPLSQWLVWQLAPLWGYTLLWNAACVTLGAYLTRQLLQDRELPTLERLLMSMMLGLTGFVLALYLVGFVGAFKPVVAIMLPAACLLIGYRDAGALWSALVQWRRSIAQPKSVERVLGSLAAIGGAAALVFLYLESLDISAIDYDATWYHWPIAQDYARIGRIVAFPGDNHRAFPHLTSMLHTWSLLVPGLPTPTQHWMLSLHLEFTIVVWRLIGAATLARWLLGGRDVRGLWAGFFLFPSIFIYDQAIGGSADHFLGFFAAPMMLAAVRALDRFDARYCALLGVALGGHVLVKYQGVYLFVAIALAVLLRLAYLGARLWLTRRRISPPFEGAEPRALLRGTAALALAFTLVSSAHFGKNVVFYHNPVYPFAQNIFKSSTPKRQPGYYTETPIRDAFEPKPKGFKRQIWALEELFTYSLHTANRNLTKKRPYMGSLFSLLLPCAVFLPTRRRFGAVAGVFTVAFLVWANSAPNDRYLLSFLDLAIGFTLAAMVEVWEVGLLARLGLVPLVGLQLVWGGDSMLYYGAKELQAALAMIADGYERRYDERLSGRYTQSQITRATPKNAVILSRNYKGLLGLDRSVMTDIRRGQDNISYAHLKDVRDLYDLLKSRGVTHLMYPKNQRQPERWNNTVLFTDLFVGYAAHQQRFGKISLGELPAQAPPRTAPYLVVAAGVRGVTDGVWSVEQLDFDWRGPERFSPRPAPRYPLSKAHEHIDQVQALIFGRRSKGLPEADLKLFHQVESWEGEELQLRRPRGAEPPTPE